MPVETLPNGTSEYQKTAHDQVPKLSQRIVLKFGGTSIGKYALQISDIISFVISAIDGKHNDADPSSDLVPLKISSL